MTPRVHVNLRTWENDSKHADSRAVPAGSTPTHNAAAAPATTLAKVSGPPTALSRDSSTFQDRGVWRASVKRECGGSIASVASANFIYAHT